ncbi:hypothetical protein EX30DRAFT_332130 [Ascodesmis nigricans]|uniref:YMC020W-like alpha/beta hydrolase domain-containing protein n=1 Tax=Ascodesmis nigricans TaxID=341454 RepID=A0A4S2MVP6_9PEZI|nr:hypothetical protein EX30DRAFT_332130 [Ascodesmis nigricans]
MAPLGRRFGRGKVKLETATTGNPATTTTATTGNPATTTTATTTPTTTTNPATTTPTNPAITLPAESSTSSSSSAPIAETSTPAPAATSPESGSQTPKPKAKPKSKAKKSTFPSVLALSAASVSATAIPPIVDTLTTTPPTPKLKSARSAEAVATVEYAYAAGECTRSGSGSGGQGGDGAASVKSMPIGKDQTKRASWFTRKRNMGVATAKSPAVTDVARENVVGESLPAATAPAMETSTGGEERPVSALEEIVTLPEPTPQQQNVAEAMTQAPKAAAEETKITDAAEDRVPTAPLESVPESAPESVPEAVKPDTTEDKPKSNPRTSWVGWWYGQPAQNVENVETDETRTPETHVKEAMTSNAATAPEQPDDNDDDETPKTTDNENEGKMDDDTASTKSGAKDLEEARREEAKQVAVKKGWFGFWGGSAQEEEGKKVEVVPKDTQLEHVPEQVAEVAAEETQVGQVSPPPPAEQVPPPPPPPGKSGGYGLGWFWSQKEEPATTTETKPTVEQGEVAVVKDDSKQPPQPKKTAIKVPEPPKPLKGSASTTALPDDTASVISKAPSTAPVKPENASTASLPPSLTTDDSAARKKLHKALPQNHLLPAFESCYTYPPHSSLLQQLTRLTPLPSFLRPASLPQENHLYLTRNPPKITRAVAIGVHGFFPMRLVRTVLGEPTGTSKRFANHAANSIRRWADAHSLPIEIETIALEGEGKVADRVLMLWNLLQSWIHAVKAADFIVIAAHSQGVPVGMQLLAKMIEEGVVKNAVRIAFIGMAGINLGPFGHLPVSILTGSAKELFEFQKQNSPPSQAYYAALEKVLKHNHTRICLVGSIDDQLVPLESSVMANISHPYIYRAVFVDGRLHTPDFLSHLVGFALKLRNLGVRDHGLVRELSSPLAGSLYGGEGHSRIYDDGCVYDLGIRHALETDTMQGEPKLLIEPFELPTNANPFFLPWSMRGLLEEPVVRTRLQREGRGLLEMFEEWRPQTKQLRDVKWRLEAVRSKL